MSEISDEEILIFARVPKTGSLGINHLLMHLRDINNFTTYSSIEGMPTKDGDTEYLYETDKHFRYLGFFGINYIFQYIHMIFIFRNQFVKTLVEASPKPTVYARHQNFFDFTEFYPNMPHPLYFSFVRHPVDRQISWYYYRRNNVRYI